MPVSPKTSASLVSLTLVFGWAGRAHATPDFPAVVVQHLGLPEVTIDPPSGCKLCHTSESGGTDVTEFGALIHADGAVAYNEQSLIAALDAVAATNPALIEDIQHGVDPNGDTAAFAGLDTPKYGCGVAPSPAYDGGAWLVLAALAWGVRSMRRGDARPVDCERGHESGDRPHLRT
jgi:hypothetical protein